MAISSERNLESVPDLTFRFPGLERPSQTTRSKDLIVKNMKESPKKVFGGSLAGLMHGIVLKQQGHHVHILERHLSSRMKGREAGITAQEDVQKLLRSCGLVDQPYAVACPGLQFLNRESSVMFNKDMPLQMTSWNALYYRLRVTFDGLPLKYCDESFTSEDSKECKSRYHLGKTVTSVEATEQDITV
ncbi:hypothetical protein MMC25_008064 [Agyrium rufum]|nr:hypothetical protein [Agyrium rufum]